MPDLTVWWRAYRRRSPAERRQLIRTAWLWVRTEGPQAALLRLSRGAHRVHERDSSQALYEEWCRRHTPDADRLRHMARESLRFGYRPLISIVTPVFNTDPRWLFPCADSVLAQAYDRWEWHIGNDGSTRPDTLEALARIAARDPRIHVHPLPRNQGISAATNVALAASSGDYVGLMDSDDALLPHALFRVVEHLNRVEALPDVVYTDEDKLELDGSRVEPYFKPDWSPELARSNMFACHFLLAKRSLLNELGGFRPAFDFSQDHDLLLRLMEKAGHIDHIADILYHWRKIPQSGATIGSAKPAAHIAGNRALQDYLDRNGLAGEVVDAGPPGFHRVRYRIGSPLVSAIGAPAAQAARDRLAATARPGRLEFLERPDRGAGTYLLFLSQDVETAQEGWLEAMLEASVPEGVGVVGPTIAGPDGLLREAGLILGAPGGASPAFEGYPASYDGYFGSGLAIRNAAAVSQRCLLTPRAVFMRLGGLRPGLGPEAQAVDYCLRVRDAGLRVVVTPWARVVDGSPLRAFALPAGDLAWLRRQWGERVDHDPFYNPHLSKVRPAYQVAI